MDYSKSSELYHHGILGQKWGRRNGPPYPLGSGDHSAAERKAGKSGWAKEARTETGNRSKSSASNKSMNSAARKRISKEYAKESKAGDNNLRKKYNDMYVDAWNKSADEMNNGGIEKYNKAQEKKYGKNYADRDGYMDDYNNLVENRIQELMAESLLNFYETDTHYQKADELVKKYDMTSWDDIAKRNYEGIEYVRSMLEKKK